jgi:hypothetical protein
MTSSSTSRDRAAETFESLSELYHSPVIAQAILNNNIEGASASCVVRLVSYLICEPNYKRFADSYRGLFSLRGGYRKLMRACRDNRRVQAIVALAGRGRFINADNIDIAMRIILAMIDAENEAENSL